MLRTYIYVPDELDEQVIKIAKRKKISKAKVMRDVMKKGIEALNNSEKNGADAFFKIAALAEKYNTNGPKDLSQNHDNYLRENYYK